MICSVPNGKLNEIYGKELLVNYKTYKYKNKIRIDGDTARLDIKRVIEPRLTKDWKRLEHFNSENQILR